MGTVADAMLPLNVAATARIAYALAMKTIWSACLVLAFVVACSDDKPQSSNESDAMVVDMSDMADSDASTPVGDCITVDGSAEGGAIEDANGRATVVVSNRDSCARTYRLSSTALRDGQPSNPRVIIEGSGPTTRTGNDIFDALHALALEEVRENSVEQISDGSFDDGNPVECGTGGCFETGRLWKYVWTRDTAYAVDLGLAGIDPIRSLNSLNYKLSERRTGGDLQVVQDTGTGGSYPVSSDRVSWAMGAETLLNSLEGAQRDAFAARALEALSNTLEHDRRIVYDAEDGLYRGEQSFLDWREQSYPAWTATDTVHIAMSKALSTNLLHFHAMDFAAKLAGDAGDTTKRDRYQAWAGELKQAIRDRLWLEDDGLFSTFVPTGLDQAPTRRFDLLGSALAVNLGVADEVQAKRILENYPHYGTGAPVQFPEQQLIPIYHNRAEWPFVSAYWLKAAAKADNPAVAERMVKSLMRGAALNLSNMENFEAASGAAYVEDGDYSGPVVNSQRQLWSVAGYLAMVHGVIFGLHPQNDGLQIAPYLTADMRNGIFKAADKLVLNDYPYMGHRVSIVVQLPAASTALGGAYAVTEIRLNDEPVTGVISAAALLDGKNVVEVILGAAGPLGGLTRRDDADWTNIFQPRTPKISDVAQVGGGYRFDIDRNGESAEVTFSVFRDGEKVAADLPNTTTSWTDTTALAGSPCYVVEATFASGNASQHSAPKCWWGAGFANITSFSAAQFTAVGGTASDSHGRFHYDDWGDAGHRLEIVDFKPTQSGNHEFQSVYGNGAGGLTTGVTCAVKRLFVEDQDSGQLVGEGALIMPHLGDWDRWSDSNLVSVELDSAKTYRIVIASDDAFINMSAFSHFTDYTGGLGGRSGEFNRVNIAELKVLYRPR